MEQAKIHPIRSQILSLQFYLICVLVSWRLIVSVFHRKPTICWLSIISKMWGRMMCKRISAFLHVLWVMWWVMGRWWVAICLKRADMLLLAFFFLYLSFVSAAKAFDSLEIKVHDVLLRIFIVIIRICDSDRNASNYTHCFLTTLIK